jgi:RNA polymerase sigma factor (TIGR02999 family)
MEERRSAIMRLSETAAAGDSKASAELLPLVYDELRVIAASMLRDQRGGHTLQPTALVNEAYLKIVGTGGREWSGRQHFQAVAAIAMRQILVNHARDRRAQKRGGSGWKRVTLVVAEDKRADAPDDADLLALDEALTKLEAIDATQARIVEMRYFAGLSNSDIGVLLGISERSVIREWRMAQAWLAAQLRERGESA